MTQYGTHEKFNSIFMFTCMNTEMFVIVVANITRRLLLIIIDLEEYIIGLRGHYTIICICRTIIQLLPTNELLLCDVFIANLFSKYYSDFEFISGRKISIGRDFGSFGGCQMTGGTNTKKNCLKNLLTSIVSNKQNSRKYIIFYDGL